MEESGTRAMEHLDKKDGGEENRLKPAGQGKENTEKENMEKENMERQNMETQDRQKTDYGLLCRQMEALAEGVSWDMTNLSNGAALLYDSLSCINWAGFYLFREGRLMLGPFQGKPACTEISMGKGVCGTAAAENRTVLVEDVHLFPGHIACDSASRSEIVVPLHKNGALYGVLDLDSPVTFGFSERDLQGLEQFAAILEQYI